MKETQYVENKGQEEETERWQWWTKSSSVWDKTGETLRGERGRETWSGSIMGELETEREQV